MQMNGEAIGGLVRTRFGGVALAGLLGLTTLAQAQTRGEALPRPPQGAERRDLQGPAGAMAIWTAGQGAPVLLVHSINAAASVHEMTPLFERLAAHRTVWAPDLPGFGASDRSDRRYDAQLYVQAIHQALQAIAEVHGPVPVDVIALSLSAEFVARAAVQQPERFASLTFVTPTGFARGSDKFRQYDPDGREIPFLHAILSVPLWSQGLFDLLTCRASVAYFLRRTWGSSEVPEALIEDSWQSARAPGARYAPLTFLSGRLFARDVRSLYESLTHPVWVAYGDLGDFSDFSESAWALDRPGWKLSRYEQTGAMVHYQHPDRFVADWLAFVQALKTP
jgi:pimeloyl-ACP methyl ester carboxylesterase